MYHIPDFWSSRLAWSSTASLTSRCLEPSTVCSCNSCASQNERLRFVYDIHRNYSYCNSCVAKRCIWNAVRKLKSSHGKRKTCQESCHPRKRWVKCFRQMREVFITRRLGSEEDCTRFEKQINSAWGFFRRNLTTLQNRRFQDIAILMFKVRRGLCPDYIMRLFSYNNTEYLRNL